MKKWSLYILSGTILVLFIYIRLFFNITDFNPKIIDYLNISLLNSSTFHSYHLSNPNITIISCNFLIFLLTMSAFIHDWKEKRIDYINITMHRFGNLHLYLRTEMIQIGIQSLKIISVIGITVLSISFMFTFEWVETRTLLLLLAYLLRYLLYLNFIGIVLLYFFLKSDISKAILIGCSIYFLTVIVDITNSMNFICFSLSFSEYILFSVVYILSYFTVYLKLKKNFLKEV